LHLTECNLHLKWQSNLESTRKRPTPVGQIGVVAFWGILATLHIHLDESGNFVFTPRGSRFYIFTVAWTYNPAPLSDALCKLRFQCIKDGHFRPGVIDDLSGFHAAYDPRPRRDAFIDKITEHRDWNFAAIVVEKNHINPSLYQPENFYPKFLSMLIKFVLKGRVNPSTQKVLVYTDTLPMASKKEAAIVNTTIKSECRLHLGGISFAVMHHTSDSNYWIQIADYCSWAICRKWEAGDTTAYDLLWPRMALGELNITAHGDGTSYY
jgi:hypothetical protein